MHRLLTHATLTQPNDRFAKDTAPSFAHRVGSPPRYVFAPLYFFVLLWYSKGRWQTTRSFLPRFRSLPCGKLSYFSGAANTVPGIRTSPVIGHVTAGLLSVTACTLHSAMQGGGGMRGASKAVKKKHIPQLWTGAKKSEAPQMVAGSLRAKVWVGLSSPLGCLGQLGIQQEIIAALVKTCLQEWTNVYKVFWDKSAELNMTQAALADKNRRAFKNNVSSSVRAALCFVCFSESRMICYMSRDGKNSTQICPLTRVMLFLVVDTKCIDAKCLKMLLIQFSFWVFSFFLT